MAINLLCQEVSDLCIGNPPLRPVQAVAVSGALAALKRGPDHHLAVLDKRGSFANVVERVSVAEIICFLCSEDNLRAPQRALNRPVNDLVWRDSGLIRRVEANFSVLEALDVILEGAQVLVVPLRSGSRRKLTGGGSGAVSGELCWLTQEDFIRYFLNSIALFSHVATRSIDALGLVRPAGDLAVRHYDPALAALPVIRRAIADQTAVAVVGDDGRLYGEISPAALDSADEGIVAAIATLSAGDLMAYIDYYGFPPESLVRAVKTGLKERNLNELLELMEDSYSSSMTSSSASSSSSDDELGPKSRRRKLQSRSRSFSIGRRSEEPAVCYPGSSLVAVMAQALAQRVSYLWVVDEADCSLVGIVTFVDVLRVLREQL